MNQFLDLLLDCYVSIDLQMSPKSMVVNIFGALTKIGKNFYCLRETEFNIKKERYDTNAAHLFKTEHVIRVSARHNDMIGEKTLPDLWKKYNWTIPEYE